MRCSSDVLKKTSPLDVFGDVSEKVKHLTNDDSNDVSPPALVVCLCNEYIYCSCLLYIIVPFFLSRSPQGPLLYIIYTADDSLLLTIR